MLISKGNPMLMGCSRYKDGYNFTYEAECDRGLPTCHETEGEGSLIPLPTNVAGNEMWQHIFSICM